VRNKAVTNHAAGTHRNTSTGELKEYDQCLTKLAEVNGDSLIDIASSLLILREVYRRTRMERLTPAPV
jgi:hypothetical protein